MRALYRTMAVVALAGLLAVPACGSGGPRKVIINEQVCAGIPFLRLRLGKEHRLILDNSQHDPNQKGMSLRIIDMPLRITGNAPEGTTSQQDLVNFILGAAPGEKKSVDVVPTFAGNYEAQCGIIVGGRSAQKPLPFQIVP